MKNLTVISDPGVDDLVALVLLQKLAKKSAKTLVSTFGNNAADRTAKNAQDYVAFIGDRWQYRQGASLPWNGKVEEVWLDKGQGENGLWNVTVPSKFPLRYADNITNVGQLVSLGPLTETANIMKAQPVNKLTIMGGKFNPTNNDNPAELNIRLDVSAAKWVFDNCANCDVQLISADAAQGVYWTLDEVKAIPETSVTNRWLKKLLLAGYGNDRYGPGKEFILYDPVAVYLTLSPEYAIWYETGIKVIASGTQRGCTVYSKTNPLCKVAIQSKNPKELSRKIYETIFLGEEL